MEIRILGRSERVRIEARSTTLYGTGNNLVLSGDMTRRAVVAQLDPLLERPELRQFTSNPVDDVLADRGRYVAAALMVVRAYMVAGSPDTAPRLASFEGWSDTVRSALIWHGRADPVATTQQAQVDDPRLAELRAVLAECDGREFNDRLDYSNQAETGNPHGVGAGRRRSTPVGGTNVSQLGTTATDLQPSSRAGTG